MREVCPEYSSERFKKNGHIHTGKQNHQCKTCGRQFVLHAANRTIGEDQRALVERLLCEKISLHGICRAVGVSLRWLMDFIVARFAALPDHLHVLPVVTPRDVLIGRLEVEADEMWSFVKQKANKQLSRCYSLLQALCHGDAVEANTAEARVERQGMRQHVFFSSPLPVSPTPRGLRLLVVSYARDTRADITPPHLIGHGIKHVPGSHAVGHRRWQNDLITM